MSEATILANPQPQSSVELVQGAKGETRVTVKVYAANPHEAADLATALYDQLRERYGKDAA